MIVDAADHDGAEEVPCDLCIAGAGAAGLTIALQFLGRRTKVIVLEGGGMEHSDASQAIYRGTIVGRDYYPLDTARLRYFGGTTDHWAGQCRPLDPLDFAVRPWVPYSGWPISPEDLRPYQDEAHEILDLGPPVYDLEAVLPPRSVLPLNPDWLGHCLWRLSPPTRFNEKYRQTFEQADNITAFLNANVVDIVLADDLRRTVAFVAVTPGGRRLRIGARVFTLALGGLENPRLLLNANRQIPVGIGNQHNLVGRFFMEHPGGATGEIVLNEPLSAQGLRYGGVISPSGNKVLAGICVSEATQERERILNLGAEVWPTTFRDASPGYAALRELFHGMADGDFSDFGRHVWEVMRDIGGTARGLYDHATGGGQITRATLDTTAEQAPNPESRVKLIDEVDRLGLRRIALDWRLSPLDKETIRVANRLLARDLGRLGVGRLRLPEWLEDEGGGRSDPLIGGCHHMGTTRMANDPKNGVVDRNCRVHGIENLYVAGSSVFCTAGYANPTLTIVELALRLADRLRAVT